MSAGEAPKPKEPTSKSWPPLAGLAFTAVALPVVFRLKFGYVDGYAIGFTAFLVILGLAVEYVPRKTEELGPALERIRVEPSRFDFLGAVWLLSIPSAPFFTWVLTNAFDVNRDNWRLLLGIRALLCVVLPIVAVLPLVRYVRRGAAGFMIAVLAIGTGFPVVTGAGSAYDVIQGPVWEAVTIERLRDVAFRTGAGTNVSAAAVFVDLSDGRTMTRSPTVNLAPGPAKVLILRGFGRIIDVAR